ncbi:MAG: MFS transporter [Rhodospirillales bacterium]
MTPPDSDPPHPMLRILPWLIWGLGTFLFSFVHFQRVAPGVMVDTLMREFAVGGALLGNLSAIYFYSYAIFQVPAGLIVDAYGSRRIMVLSALLIAAGCFVFAQAETITGAFIGRLLTGIGGGATFVVALNLAAVWFPPARFALLSGLTVGAGVAGAVVGQVPLAWAVDAVGWRPAMLVTGAVALAAGIGAMLALRLPRPRTPGARPVRPGRGGLLVGFRTVLAQRDLWILTGAGSGNMSVMLAFGGLWAVPWLVQVHGMTRGQAAVAVSLNAVGWVVGSPLLGWIGQRLGGRRVPFVCANLVSLACYAILILVPGHGPAALHGLLFLQGLATGAVVLVFTTTHERFAGQESVTLGIVNTGIMFAIAVFQPLVGWVLDLNWHGDMVDGARIYDAAAYQSGLSLLLIGGVVAVLSGLMLPETAKARARGGAD